ncbi:MAG TPA: WcbI family polysaccharide biosynthesis putative acetyltransferase [Conexibacter sp.]|nr:WcbI family polysaccharide biosynthesis putative acetyltransferase [Conexibacter sp.]
MDRAVVVGNCQAKALELMLTTNDAFKSRFELVSFPAVHEIPDAMVPELHAAVAGAALVIPQRVDEGYRDGIGLGTETLARIAGTVPVLRWPSVFWAGYVPDLFYLRGEDGRPVVDGPFDYHDRTILKAYAAGLDVAAACALLADPEQPSDAPSWADRATAELEVRGQGCEIHVASFIAERFRDELLFFTMNHPSNRLLAHMAQQVVDHLGLPGSVDPVRLGPDDLLGSTFYPLHANHVRALGLRFGAKVEAGRASFRIRGVVHEAPEAVAAFYDYYDAHPELAALNCT